MVVNKERGFTSFDVVAKLRGILQEKKIGHLGTLDPEAEGVLPIVLGRATKLVPLLTGGEKTYRAVLHLGIRTDSQDTTGRLLERKPVEADEEQIRRIILSFVGEQNQLPPMVSAKKVDGRKLVDLAREGKEVERKPCRIRIERIEILSMEMPRVEMRIVCSAGTYIRTLCHDIGEKLGCGGAMESLVREEASGFSLLNALRLDEITSLSLTGGLSEKMLSLEELLDRFPAFSCLPRTDGAASNGNVLRPGWGKQQEALADGRDYAVRLSDGRPVGVYRYEFGKDFLKPAVMLGPEEAEKHSVPHGSVVSIGKFDGVHLGHQAIIRKMLEEAEESGLGTVLFSFTNPPEGVLGGRREDLILSADEKRLLVKTLGIRKLVEARFTQDMRDMPAERFLKEVLIGRLGMKKIVAGPDCSFGKGREGNIDFLQRYAGELGYTVYVVDKVRTDGEIVSSSRIKNLLREGHMEEAEACLGRPYFVSGRVGYGRHLGESIGFPTLNISLPPERLLPPFGVYAALCELEGKTYPAMCNIGVKPTVGGEQAPNLEVHLPGEKGNWYGASCRVDFKTYIRPEKRFDSLDALRQQLTADRESIRQYFKKD